jgi:hypothetical protein
VCVQPAGTGERDYRAVDLRQPKGFVSYFNKARDYDGVFDFVPRAARPKVGRPPFSMHHHLNFEIGSGPGRLHVINDNGGNLFHFSPLQPGSQMLIDVDAANAADAKFATSVGGRPLPLAPAGPVIACVMQDLLEMIARPTHREFYDRLVAAFHADACETSFRSYSNLAYHNLLDWRGLRLTWPRSPLMRIRLFRSVHRSGGELPISRR